MLMSIRFLTDVGSVNIYDYIEQLEITAGDSQSIYFQLVDLAIDRSSAGFNPPGRRYMPAATATLAVTLLSVECGKQVLRAAIQPYPQDPSIWMVPILGSDPLQGTINMNMRLTEPSRILNISNGKGNIIRIR